MSTFEGDDDSYDEIDKKWRKIWRNVAGQFHRDGDLPAIIWANGNVFYYKNSNRHRDDDKPAVNLADGSVAYYKDGFLHRDGDVPAIIRADGSVEYWVEGVQQK